MKSAEEFVKEVQLHIRSHGLASHQVINTDRNLAFIKKSTPVELFLFEVKKLRLLQLDPKMLVHILIFSNHPLTWLEK